MCSKQNNSSAENGCLSEVLLGLLKADDGEPLTVNAILMRTGDRGVFLAIVLLTLPFLAPLLPGMSTPFGLAIMYLALYRAFGRSPVLPKKIGEKGFSGEKFEKVIHATAKLLRFIEHCVKPRFSFWLRFPMVEVFHWGVIAFLALLLALPLPLPASNLVPAYSLVIVTVSAMERDGWMMLVGYLATLCSITWIGLFFVLGQQAIEIVFLR